jgi:hypothetical protein
MEVVSCSNITKRQIIDCFDPAGSRHLEHFIDLTGMELLRGRRCALEVVDDGDRNFALFYIPTGTWKLSANGLVQEVPYMPDVDGTPFKVALTTSEFTLISSDAVQPSLLEKMWSEIERLDGGERRLLSPSDSPPNIRAVQAFFDVAVLKATGIISWPPRPRPKTMTTFYHAIRTLNFRKCLALFRNDVIRGMNAALQILGKKYDFDARIEVCGLRSPEEFDAAVTDMLEGRAGPSVVRNFW